MQYILMDLDGTLTNPKLGITKSVQYALRSFGIETEDLDTLTRHIGPPIKTGFMEYYDFTDEQADLAVKKYREYFIMNGGKQFEGKSFTERQFAGREFAG